jgi:hypothetical protein
MLFALNKPPRGAALVSNEINDPQALEFQPAIWQV